MTGPKEFCLACFRLVPAEASRCPLCGADRAALSAADYEHKLLHALEHPLTDVRMRAIIAIGLRGNRAAVPVLQALALRHPVDVIEGQAVVECLRKLGNEGRVALGELAEQHPAKAVRRAAGRTL